jgi:hypothetical protein
MTEIKTWYYVPASGGRIVSMGSTWLGWADDRQIIYYCEEGAPPLMEDPRSGLILASEYPFVLPLPPRLPGFWDQSFTTKDGASLRPNQPFRRWAKETMGSNLRIHKNDMNALFYQFRTEADLMIFKMRWADELYY